MAYSLMIAPFDFANHDRIAAQQFFDNYAIPRPPVTLCPSGSSERT